MMMTMMWMIALGAVCLFAPGPTMGYSCYDCIYSDLSQDVGVTNDCSDPFQPSQAPTCTGNLCVIAWLDFNSYGFVVNRTCASDGPPFTDPNQCLMLNSWGLPYTFFVYADMCCAESPQSIANNGTTISFTAYACFCTVDQCNGAIQNFITRTHPPTTTRTKAVTTTTTTVRKATTTTSSGRVSTGTGTPGSKQTDKSAGQMTSAKVTTAAAGKSTAMPTTTAAATTAKIGSTAAGKTTTTKQLPVVTVGQTGASKQSDVVGLETTATTMMPTTMKQPNNNGCVVVRKMSLLLHAMVAVVVVAAVVASMSIVF